MSSFYCDAVNHFLNPLQENEPKYTRNYLQIHIALSLVHTRALVHTPTLSIEIGKWVLKWKLFPPYAHPSSVELLLLSSHLTISNQIYVSPLGWSRERRKHLEADPLS